MSSFMVHFKIGLIDVRMFGISLGTAYGIKLGPNERTCLGYFLDSSERSRNKNIEGSLELISQKESTYGKLDDLLNGI